jgi:hypothetical protein
MARFFFHLFALWVLHPNSNAQTGTLPLTNHDDQARIALTAVIPEEAEALPAPARPVLINRLRQLANSAGYAGSANSPQFILAANPVVVEKKVAGTAPLKIWVELEMTLYIADQYSKSIFATTSINLKGIGATDAEAYTEAFKNLQVSKKELRDFAQKGRDEIVAFYNTRCDFIMSRVEMLVNTNQADAALDMLLRVPEVSESCFKSAVAKSKEVYLASAEQQCQTLIQAAKTAWANAPDRKGAEQASSYLSVVPVQAKCRQETDALLNEIKSKMQESEKWERQQYRDELDLMRRYVAALRDIGVAYGNGQPNQQIIVKGWLW